MYCLIQLCTGWNWGSCHHPTWASGSCVPYQHIQVWAGPEGVARLLHAGWARMVLIPHYSLLALAAYLNKYIHIIWVTAYQSEAYTSVFGL
jgi:hypothetical protein